MAAYVVMEPPRELESVRDAVFIRDSFAIWAFVAPLLWLLWHRLWIEAALVFAVSLLIGVLADGNPVISLLSLPVSIYLGLEGRVLRINTLRRRGWRDVTVVEANSLDEAEIHYGAAAMTQEVRAEASWPEPASAHSDPATGLLFGMSGR